MVDVTLFEVHLDDSKLTANAPFSRGEKSVVAGEEPSEEAEESESSSKGTLLAAIVGLVFLVGVAYLARQRMGEAEGEQVELADVET